MIKITVSADCGNSPNNQFLKQLNIAFANSDFDFIIGSVTDKIVWNIVGNKKIEGKEKFTKELEIMKPRKVSELIVERKLTHGKEGAVSGVLKYLKIKNDSAKLNHFSVKSG